MALSPISYCLGVQKERFVTKLCGLSHMAAVMRDYPDNGRLQLSGCRALDILTKSPELKEYLLDAGCIELVGVIFRVHKNTQNDQVTALKSVARQIMNRLTIT